MTYDTIHGHFFRDQNCPRFSTMEVHNWAKNVEVLRKRKFLKYLIFKDLYNLKSFKSNATNNRKSNCIALSFNKLYIYYDVSP